jgi:hypothetical protein
MVDLNAVLTPSMSNMTSPLLTSIVLMVFRNDRPRTRGDEVDLLSILEVEFLLEIPTMSGLRFRSCVARHLCLQNFFLDHPQNI